MGELTKKFDIKDFRPSWMAPRTEPLENNRVCLMCPTLLTLQKRYYCSGFCLAAAKQSGLYGKETKKA